MVECFPNNYLGWHLGKVGKFAISKMSGGVELNNFGYLTKKGDKYYTYVNTEVKEEFVCDLGYEFRGKRYWHAYSPKQIESLRLLILHLKDIYPKMDLVNGIPKMLKDGVSEKMHLNLMKMHIMLDNLDYGHIQVLEKINLIVFHNLN